MLSPGSYPSFFQELGKRYGVPGSFCDKRIDVQYHAPAIRGKPPPPEDVQFHPPVTHREIRHCGRFRKAIGTQVLLVFRAAVSLIKVDVQHAGICYVLLALPGREGLRLHPHQFEEVQHPLGKKEAEVVLVELCLCSILIHDYKGTSFHGIYLNGWIFISYQTRIFAGEPFSLLCLFIIGCGLTCLETAANPYVTVLGEPDTAASRLNLAQSLNGLGWIVGPLVGGLIIFGDSGSVALPYAVIGIAVLVIAVLFSRMQLPEIVDIDTSISEKAGIDKLSKSASYLLGLVALFAYVAAQTGVNSFFINYVTEASSTITNQQAALMLSFGGMGFFLVGRLLGTWLMNYLSAPRLLLICAMICMIGVICGGTVGLISLIVTYLFESIMFPTIFALALQGLSTSATKRGSSYLIMTVVGGAIAPMLMGYIGENNMAIGFIIPLVCYLVVATYAQKDL